MWGKTIAAKVQAVQVRGTGAGASVGGGSKSMVWWGKKGLALPSSISSFSPGS